MTRKQEYDKLRYKSKKEEILKTVKRYYLKHRDDIIKKVKEWGRKNRNKTKVYTDKWRSKNKEKQKAHTILNEAIRWGKLKKPERCFLCGKIDKLEGHHKDYNKPLDVIWLCVKCHNHIHGDV